MRKLKFVPLAGWGMLCPFFKKMFVVVLLVLLIVPAFAQPDNRQIAVEKMQQDFTSLRDSLEKYHAGLYRYKTKPAMDRVFDHLYKQLNRPMTPEGFFEIVSQVISSIDDGHTECFPSKEDINYLKQNAKWFPLPIKFIGKKAFVSCSSPELMPGTEIKSVNGVSVNKIRKELFAHLSSDGYNETGKYEKLNGSHDPFFYSYYMAYGEQPTFKLTYKTPGGANRDTTINAVSLKQIECPSMPVTYDQYLSLTYKPGNVAVLTLNTFLDENLEKTHENFKTFLAGAFKELNDRKIEKLIIDLRENGGGEDMNGVLLYGYLTDNPFSYYASINSNKKVFTASDHTGLNVQQPQAVNFKGKVEFLIGGKSFSGAAEFAAIAKSNGRGKLVGEETGGGYFGNTSGSRLTISLPNSRIRVNIPLKKYVLAVKSGVNKDRGVIPDYVVVPTIEDILKNNDVQLNEAMKLFSK